jgi:hypothetical protein
MCLLGHFAATLRATSARLGALFQHWVVGRRCDLFATSGAPIASLGANAACVRVQIRASKHEIDASGAHLSTILQPPKIVCLAIFPGLFQGILQRRRANRMATGALVNTGLHTCFSYHVELSSRTSFRDFMPLTAA